MRQISEHGFQRFEVETETGEIKEAEILHIVEIDDKKYAIYSVDNVNDTELFASYVEKDDDGYDILVDIENPEEMAKITAFVVGKLSDAPARYPEKINEENDVNQDEIISKLAKGAADDISKMLAEWRDN